MLVRRQGKPLHFPRDQAARALEAGTWSQFLVAFHGPVVEDLHQFHPPFMGNAETPNAVVEIRPLSPEERIRLEQEKKTGSGTGTRGKR